MVLVLSVVPCGVGSGAEYVVGAVAQLQDQVSAAELQLAGKMTAVGSAVVGPDCKLGEMVDDSATVVEKLVLPEVVGSQEHQVAANTEAEKPLEGEDYTLQEWALDALGWVQA